MMNNIATFVSDTVERLDDLEGQVNGNFSNDGLIELYDLAKELEDTAESFRKDTVKSKVIERARTEGVRDTKNRLVLQGDNRGAIGYARSYSKIRNEVIKDAVKDSDMNKGEAVDYLFDLMKANGLSKTSVRDKVEVGDLPDDSIEERNPNHEDQANIVSTRDERLEDNEIRQPAQA